MVQSHGFLLLFSPDSLSSPFRPRKAGGGKPLDHEVPIHVVTEPSQLPAEFLNPSAAKQLIIGFDCEGVDLCRHGTLCVMQLAFPDAIYLVDAIKGGESLIRACKPALESSHITKVIHDCKRDSEALYFQFGIKLHNVVDTQIAYSQIEEQEGRTRLPDDYISFVGLLADPRYCGILYVAVFIYIVRFRSYNLIFV
ncbi:piRNA biogenesis protein EXD1-like isoform X2 [Populus alba x Populus x berolinensis]|nr:piRNA biogenesis protein EXD1-like isoform X2 [Populus alba x Populus x berolinensis]